MALSASVVPQPSQQSGLDETGSLCLSDNTKLGVPTSETYFGLDS